MPATVSSSALQVSPSRIRELAEIAFRMDGVLKLYFGESNLPTPEYIKQAARQALADGHTYYTENAGTPSLRKALAAYYQRTQGATLDPQSQIVVTASGVQALHLGIRCLLDPGDEGIVLTPAWPNGSAIVQMSNATVRQIPHVLAGKRYQIDFATVEAAITSKTRMLLYTSPSNPLGWVATEEDQRRLLELSRRHGFWLVADEVYDRLCYRDAVAAPSILKMASAEDAVLVVQSFSKAYCMTGWRLGWLAGRADLIRRATMLNEFVVSHAASFTQRAGETALADGEPAVAEMMARLRENRDFCVAALREMPGLTIPEPDGAFYLFPRVDGLTDSFEFCKQLLLETKVGLAPGVAFGAGGEGSVRICYAAEKAILEQAMERLGRFLRAR